ncbi:DUF7661 family protein [Microbulbifer sp. SSSA005]|uniref:DUF7661 family protein n=1 Tax=Microbulbifer sp. SSSA005 TaxID=3243378 RepID=UPI004039DAC5
MKKLKFNVFGREVLIERQSNSWATFYQGNEGKRRSAGISIPSGISEKDLAQYLADICHEWASERFPAVERINTK